MHTLSRRVRTFRWTGVWVEYGTSLHTGHGFPGGHTVHGFPGGCLQLVPITPSWEVFIKGLLLWFVFISRYCARLMRPSYIALFIPPTQSVRVGWVLDRRSHASKRGKAVGSNRH